MVCTRNLLTFRNDNDDPLVGAAGGHRHPPNCTLLKTRVPSKCPFANKRPPGNPQATLLEAQDAF